MTTTDCSDRSSSGANVRPCAALTPSSGKTAAETSATTTLSGSATPDSSRLRERAKRVTQIDRQ